MARTDDDTWDLASGVGVTATMIATQRALGNRAGLIDDPFAEPLVRAVGAEFFTRMLDGDIDLANVDPGLDLQRAVEGIVVRTRFFDRLFIDAAAVGIRQAVILAAGLDARAYRLPWPDGTIVYEVDQPEVIVFKTQVLSELGAKPTAQRRTLAIDLRTDWPKALIQNGFDHNKPTAWIAEGLLVYLPPAAQDRLFDNITKLSAPGSRLATEHIPDTSLLSGQRSQRMSERLKKYGLDIQMKELIYHGQRSQVVEHLATLGWQASAQTMPEAYAANGFEFVEDEITALFANVSYVSAVRG